MMRSGFRHEFSEAQELAGGGGVDRATAIFIARLIVPLTVGGTMAMHIVAGAETLEIAGVKVDRLAFGKLLARVFVVIQEGLRLHVVRASALGQIAGFVAGILCAAALVDAHTPAGRLRRNERACFDRLAIAAAGKRQDQGKDEESAHTESETESGCKMPDAAHDDNMGVRSASRAGC
jgi:hypothetical protein